MADEKGKAIENDQETINPTGGKTAEFSEKDLDKASGGSISFGKWIELDKV
jgi:hypothetical protein